MNRISGYKQVTPNGTAQHHTFNEYERKEKLRLHEKMAAGNDRRYTITNRCGKQDTACTQAPCTLNDDR